MNIIVTNDDSYTAQGIRVLTDIMSSYGKLTVVSPKYPQSGMSMAVSMGFKPIAVKHLGDINNQDWWYLDGTPASCVKYAQDNILEGQTIDLVVSGINHGSNAATAALYSGTIGAAMEGAINGILGIGVSLDTFDHETDFSACRQYLPEIIDKIIKSGPYKYGTFFNINFPTPGKEIKGIKVCYMGKVHWEKEYQPYEEFMNRIGKDISQEALNYIANADKDEKIYIMAGDMTDNGVDNDNADHRALEAGYITITPHNLDNTHYPLISELCAII